MGARSKNATRLETVPCAQGGAQRTAATLPRGRPREEGDPKTRRARDAERGTFVPLRRVGRPLALSLAPSRRWTGTAEDLFGCPPPSDHSGASSNALKGGVAVIPLRRFSRWSTVIIAMLGTLLLGMPAAVAAPANDDFDTPMLIEELPFEDTADTTAATTADDDPYCAGQGATVWYAFTASADTWVEANTSGSQYDTTLSAYTGSRGDLTQLACNDDYDGLQSRIVFAVSEGVTYYLMAGAYGDGAGGLLQLAVFETGEPPPPPPSMEFSLAVDSGTFNSRTGAATISGTATCSTPGWFEAGGSVRQRAGRAFITGWFYVYGACDGVTPFTVTTYDTNGRFAGGAAEVSMWGEAWDGYSWDHDDAFSTLRLRGGRN
jgi:hypothetical protein